MDIAKKDLGGNAEAEVVLYQPDSSIHIEVLVEGETVWLTQQQMSELFSTTRNNITLHIRNIFNEGELDEDSVCKESLQTAEMVFFEGGFYRKWRKESHDRWLVIDDKLYHCGHSLNANGGHKISAITLMGTSPEAILGQVR